MTAPMQDIAKVTIEFVSGDEIAGQGVYFPTDNIGVLEGFAPIEDADLEVAQ